MRFVLSLALAVTATACLGGEDGDGTSYVAVDEMPAAYKDAYCTYLARCGVFPDQATCVSAMLSVVPTLDPNVIAAVYAGRIVYNGNHVKECFDAVANDTCDQTDANGRTHTAACSAYFQGTVAGGGECVLDQECVSQFCSGGSTDVTCARGTCIGDVAPIFAPIAIGAPCASNTACVDGAYCDDLSGLCTALQRSGAPCNNGTECDYGLGCAGATGARTCQPLPAVGETCRLDLPCRDDGQFCNTATSVCAQVGTMGAPCTSTQQCSQYYRCDTATGTCTQTPTLGQSCAAIGRCFDAASYCDSTTLVCTAVKPDGTPCDSGLECESRTCDFDQVTPVCSSPPLCL